MVYHRVLGDTPLTQINNSLLELNVAIVVSSAPAFASFARSHFPEVSAIKSFFSSLTSFPGKTRNPESTAASSFKADRMPPNDGEQAEYHPNHHYYELNETYGLQSGASVDQSGKLWAPSSSGLPGEGGIVRTTAFEQTVKKSAV